MKLLIVYEGSLRFLFYFILFYLWHKLIYAYVPSLGLETQLYFVLVNQYLAKMLSGLSSLAELVGHVGSPLNLIRHSLIRSSGLRVSPRLTYHVQIYDYIIF